MNLTEKNPHWYIWGICRINTRGRRNRDTDYAAEIFNNYELVVSINEEEETEMFPEGARFIQDINDVMKTLPEGTSNKV